jgi:hypothetical protein
MKLLLFDNPDNEAHLIEQEQEHEQIVLFSRNKNELKIDFRVRVDITSKKYF